MISLWEQNSLTNYDVIIVGAGITGLSTAASLKEQQPELNVLIIERGVLPTGASTKNAGFACFGSLTELEHDLKTLGEAGMIALVQRRWNGLKKTRERLGDAAIDLQIKGGYELLDSTKESSLQSIDSINQLLGSTFDQPVFSIRDELIKHFGFRKTNHLIINPFEGQLDTGKLIHHLWKYVAQLGVSIITGTEVLSVEEQETKGIVRTPTMNFTAKAIGLCTNAFTKTLMPQLEVTPGRGMVLVVNPEKPLAFEGTFHYQEGYYYFRDFYGKLVFGGGRNLDLEAETTLDFGINPKIENKLHELLEEVILPGTRYQVEMKWSGIMAFGATKEPIVKPVSDRCFVGVRLGGMGVAIGSMVGHDLAGLILESHF